MRESLIFYRSFMDAMEDLTPEQCKNLMMGMAHYAMDDITPELNGIEATLWKVIKPQIDANNKRAADGAKGGRPKKEKTSGFEDENHRLPDEKPKVKVKVKEKVKVNNKFCDYPQAETDFSELERKVFIN